VTQLPSALVDALADRYAIERELGHGGMATVYLARDLRHDRNVALKVLRPELAAVIGAERFLAEIKTTANLQHPHILPLLDSGDSATRGTEYVYYVMPFVEGESLRDRLTREHQLPVEDTVRIAAEVASALDYAHRHGVVHRDIKPENILLHDGSALVADFGIALAVSRSDGGTRMTETGMSLGTPQYMSPEQAMGEREITPRSDVYALGSVLYEMLSGEPPFTGPTAQAIVARVMTEEPRSLTLQRRTIPPNVEAAVRTALQKLPADRFASAAEFGAALANPSYGAGVATTPGAAAGAPDRRWRTLAIASGAVAVAALALAAWSLRRPARAPLLRYELGLGEGERMAGVRGSRVALSADGTKLVYPGPGQRLWLRDRSTLSAAPMPGTDRATTPWMSPDGTRVAFLIDQTPLSIKVASLGGAPPVTLTDSGVGLDGLTWSDDGFIYFDGITAGGTVGLMRLPAAGGAAEQVTTVDTARGEADHVWPAALPHGRGVLFTIQSRRNDAGPVVAVYDSRRHTWHALTQGLTARYATSGQLVYVTADGRLLAAPFDLDRLAIRGEAVSLADSVAGRSFGAVDISLSASGTLMYVAGASTPAPSTIVSVSRDGRVTPLDPGWTADFRTLALSPDGQRLAVSVAQGPEQQVWIKQLPRGPFGKLTFNRSGNYRPVWSPDGKRVIFTTNRSGTEEIYSQRADGSEGETALIRRSSTRMISEALYSRDGKWLVYRTIPRDIFARRVGPDTTEIPIVTSAADEVHPALSPDGRWIAYTSNASGQPEVYVRPFPGSGDARWQVSTAGGLAPIWAHSGRELFYGDLTDSVVAVEVLPGPSFRAGTPRALFSAAWGLLDFHGWDITPDDRSFVMIRQSGPGAAQDRLVVIENLPAEVARAHPR
jgi:eukaryotic-like serine/threonine-protein kinase